MNRNKAIKKLNKDTDSINEFLEYLFDDSITHTEEEIVARVIIRNMANRTHTYWLSDKANTERRDS